MFEQALAAFRNYRIALEKANTEYDTDLAFEVESRLKKLDILLELIAEAESKPMEGLDKVQSASDLAAGLFSLVSKGLATPELHERDMLTAEALTEGFYYCAHRIRQIFRDKKKPFPGLSNFEAVGLREVRNNLLEHPDVVAWSFGVGADNGPVLKGARTDADRDAPHDKGLYPNAQEFADQLENTLRRATPL